MLLSQTSHYALRAVFYLLSNKPDEWHLTKDIAESTRIPAPYLARILSTLAKRGILNSRTGMGGGFSIGDKKLKINLYEIVNQFDNLDNINDCIFGFEECCPKGKCVLHDPWQKIKSDLIGTFKTTTLRDLKDSHSDIDWSRFPCK